MTLDLELGYWEKLKGYLDNRPDGVPPTIWDGRIKKRYGYSDIKKRISYLKGLKARRQERRKRIW